MTSETIQGFTHYGRPVTESRRRIEDLTIEIILDDEKPHNVNDVYTLIGASGAAIAENLKTYAFARSAALRWSRMLGECVSLMRHEQFTNPGTDTIINALVLDSVAAAHTVSADQFAAELLAAERDRLINAVNALRENEMDMRAAREDASAALKHIDALAQLLDAPGMPIVEMARAAAEAYETLEWYVLVKRDDADMIGELSAVTA